MLKQNILISFRNIKRNKSSFFVNLFGLSTGLACVLLIFLWVQDELNIDKYHEKDSQLFQVLSNIQMSDGLYTVEQTPGLLAQALSEEMAEVEFATSVIPTSGRFGGDGILSVDNKEVKAGGLFADKDYFSIFSINFVQGDKNKAFFDENSIVISKALAGKLFQTTDNVIGKTVEWDHERFKRTLTISGVFENYPYISTVRPDLIFNYDLYLEIDPKTKKWTNIKPLTYLIIKKGTNIDSFNDKIAGFVESKSPGSYTSLFVQQYSKRYLYGPYENGLQAGGRIEYVKLFSIIALFILIIACVNFMNLSTAKSSGKLKEVGIKKAIGSNRKALIMQFLEESLLITFIALLIAVILIAILLPQFREITGKPYLTVFSFRTIIYALIITLFAGLFSGIYPAMYISGFSSISVLKGKLKSSLSELWIRKGLVIFQFSLSVILIIGFIVINKQMDLIQTKNLGYDRDNVLCFKRKGELKSDFPTFMSELKKIPGVVDASNMYGSIADGFGSTNSISWDGQTEDQKITFPNQEVSYDFIETLGIKMKEGRSFSREFSNEDKKVIFNEAAIKLIGYKDPVGKYIKYGGEDLQIIGVTENYNFKTLYKNLEPCFLRFSPEGWNILVKIKAGEELATIVRLKDFNKKFSPKYPFEFTFLDDEYQSLYESETRMSFLSRYFAGIAILISCLGLFVLSVYSTERRTKEIGIRKVNGAQISEILTLLNKDFIKWVIIAFVIATPIAWYVMSKWLEKFAYKTDLSWWIFALAGLLALGIALLTVSWQSWRAATRNPVESLKYE